MIRVLSLLALAVLLTFAWYFGGARPVQLAAFETGLVAAEPLSALGGPGWQALLGPGDQIRLEDGRVATIHAVEDGQVLLEGAPEVRVSKEAVTGFLKSSRTLLQALRQTSLVEIQGEGKASTAAVHLGTLAFESGASDSQPQKANLDREARLSLVRQLRSSLAEDHKLIDQNLSEPESGAPSGSLRFGDEDRMSLRIELGPNAPWLASERTKSLPGPLSLAPPLIAILLAILLRRPVVSLLAGVVGGAWVVYGLQDGHIAQALTQGTPAVVTKYLKEVLTDRFRFEIIGFVIAMLAMVGVMTRSGGVQGLMDRIARLAGSARRTQLATWIMGLAVFFDDYANTILVGATMRPLTDRFKVAREKLAYIVDSTAAPVAGLSLFSTWIAFEVSTFKDALPDAGLATDAGYAVFLQTLPYRFYCIFTLAFVGIVVLTGRDFGPMLRAERRARAGQLLNPGSKPMVGHNTEELMADPNIPHHASAALIPLAAFIGVTLFAILYSGGAFHSKQLGTMQGWADVLYNGSGSAPLLYGALAGLALAVLLAWKQGVRSGLAHAALHSVRSMGVALAILYLAWMLGAVCVDLGTSNYLTVQLGDAIPPLILPTVLFLLASLVAFSTGSSWSTMTILLPLVVGLSFRLGEASSIGGSLLMIMSIGAVLEGAIFGDHCSPISDTTVMSSIASASDHIDHVRTQMPYALLTMGTAVAVGYLPCTYLASRTGSWLPFVCWGLGITLLVGFLFLFGGKTADLATGSKASQKA